MPDDDFKKNYFDQLNVFYVASTRARKDVYYTLSYERLTQKGEKAITSRSCFLSLPGLIIEKVTI
jgi:DNA helicase-2/ATP-dependent DNA helicase PcrA